MSTNVTLMTNVHDHDEEIVVEEEEEEEEEYMEVTDDELDVEEQIIDDDDAIILDEEGQDNFYFDEETVVEEEEEGMAYLDEGPLTKFVISASSHRNLMPLDEEHELVEIIDEVIEEEVVEEDDEDLELEGEDADDESSAWIDDGRDYTKNPDAVAPRSFHFRDHFAEDSGDEENKEGGDQGEDDAFYLNIPEIESVSSLEDLSGGEESQSSSIVMEELLDEAKGSKRKLTERQPSSSTLDKSLESLNQSVDWDANNIPLHFGEEDEADDELMSTGGIQDEMDDMMDLKDAFTAHSRVGLSLKRIRKATPLFYGRQPELERIRKALAGIHEPGAKNPKRLVWIYGSSGVGKTALAEAFLRDHISSSADSNFIVGRGSFDERSAQAQNPYSALVDCLMEVVNQLMQDQVDADSTWRDRIGEGLGKEARLLTMVIPNISKLLEIEEDPIEFENTFELATGRLFDRLRFIMRRFLRIVCRYRKVVVFLDDLQWADEDSLRMIDTILSTHALKNFFFIGCHRGVKRTHILPRVKTKLAALSAMDLMMKPLDKKAVKDCMVHFLQDNGPEVNLMASQNISLWMAEKSSGDPFHLEQLLHYLVEHGKLDKSEGEWKWDYKALQRDQTIPTTAVDLVAERIKKLSPEATLVMKSAAFLGLKVFHLQTLYRAVQVCSSAEKKGEDCPFEDASALVDHLDAAVDANLLEALSPGYYEFTHDTIRKSAALLLPKSDVKLSSMHHQFASQLNKEVISLSHSSDERETMLLLVADHFSLATDHIKETQERESVARLHLNLAEGAIRKASFNTAVLRIELGLSLLDQKSQWKDSYDLTLKLHLELSRVRFCQGKFDEAKMFADVLLANSKIERDKIGTYELLIWVAVARNQLGEAFRLVSLALKEVWDESPSDDVEKEVGAARGLLSAKPDAELLMLPEMTHKKTASKLVFLARSAEISWMRQDFLNQDLAALKMLGLTIRYGSSRFSSLAFALYGICLARRNLHKEAYRYGHLAEMTAKAESPFGAQAITFHHYAIAYWRRPFQASLEPLRKAAFVALESNDMENLSFRVGAFLSHAFATGARLNTGDDLFRRFKEYSVAFRGRSTWLATVPFRLILKLRGEPLEPAERGFEKYTDSRASQYLTYFQMIHAVFMQDMEIADKLSNRLVLKPEGVWLPMRGFMEGLIATSLARASTGKTRIRHQRKAAKIIEVLGGWAKNGLKQVYHMANLVNVELRMLSDAAMGPTQASALYDSAIASANKAGFLHHEALANERAGTMFHSQQEDGIATKYLTRACELYKIWGANAKVRHLKAKFPRNLDLPDMKASKSAFDPFDFSDFGSGPSLDFGESQIIHFNPTDDLAPRASAPGRGVASAKGGRMPTLRTRMSKTGQRAGRGPPIVRVPPGARGRGTGLIRGRSRGRGMAGTKMGVGTPGRGTPARTTVVEPRPAPIERPEGPKSKELDISRAFSETPVDIPAPLAAANEPKPELQSEERKGAKDLAPKLEPPLHSASSGEPSSSQNEKSKESDESDLSDEDSLRPSSERSDLGTQSDYGPRYKDEKKDKKKNTRRKLKASSKKSANGDDEDSDGDAQALRPRSLHSGLDAFNDSESLDVHSYHGPSAHQRSTMKMRRKVTESSRKKKDKKDTKRSSKVSKSSTKLMSESQKILNVEGPQGTIKKKSKAKLAEDEEKKKRRPSKLKMVEPSVLEEMPARRKIPSRSQSEGAMPTLSKTEENQDSVDTADDQTIDKTSDHSKSQPGRSVSLGGKPVKKVKRKSKSIKKSSSRKLGESELSSSKRNDTEEGTEGADNLGDKAGEQKTKDDEMKSKAKKTSSRKGGLVRSLSWNGKRKKKSKDTEDGGGDGDGDDDVKERPRRSKSFTMGSDSGKKLTKLKKGKKPDSTSGDTEAKKTKKSLLGKIKRISKKNAEDEAK